MTKMTMNINELADTLGVSVKAIYIHLFPASL